MARVAVVEEGLARGRVAQELDAPCAGVAYPETATQKWVYHMGSHTTGAHVFNSICWVHLIEYDSAKGLTHVLDALHILYWDIR